MGQRRTTAKEIQDKLPDHLTLDASTYIKASVKAKFIDKDYGEFWVLPTNFLARGARGHPQRTYDEAGTGRRISIEDVKAQLPSHITIDESTYTLTNNKARFIDKDYGEFWSTFERIRRGSGHPKRGLQDMKDALTTPIEEVKAALPPHLKLVEHTYKHCNEKALFIDEKYGEWWAPPQRVFQGGDHPKRGFDKISKAMSRGPETIISKLPPHLMLDVSTYAGANAKCKFVDRDYGEFWSLPYNVLKNEKSGHPLRTWRRSTLEDDVGEFISKFAKVANNNSFVDEKKKRFEADMFLPEQNLVVEFNGLFWHSSVYKQKDYHWTKREFFNKKGLEIIQIFENEWNFKQDIVKSIILHKLKLSAKKYQARKLLLKSVSNSDAQTFLLQNHIMGGYKTAKYVGLYDKDLLVCLMGYKVKQNKIVEISRFCNSLNTSVAGGLTRLLRYVERLIEPKQVIYWIDLRYGTATNLEALGFNLEKITLGWQWTDFKNTYNRLFCRANMDGRGLSEKEHAKEMKLFRIYDAGQAKLVKNY